MSTGDPNQLRREAVERIIFHATPREMLSTAGPFMLERGEGAFLYDDGGNRYLDALSGGVFTVLAGYGRNEIADAMHEQAGKLPYTSPYGATSAITVELANKLAELTPDDLSASFFCNSGSEAVEAAIKLSRQYHEANGEGRRYKVVSLRRGYHGATVGALSATGWSPGFGFFRRTADPMVPAAGYANAMPPYCHRCELSLTHPECQLACATTIEQAILGGDPELVSCVILEPIMGTGGCIVPPTGYLARVREICDRYGILMISDEVVCGFGRTGSWFGVNHFDVVPDIMVVAKGLTSGYAPMAAAITRPEIADRIPIFFNVHTYGGHPISAAAAQANLRIIQREGLVENSAELGSQMIGLLEELRTNSIVGDVRGKGLFMAVELELGSEDDFGHELRVGNQVAGIAQSMGLLVRPLGATILLAPPLIFTKELAQQAVEILDKALSTVQDTLQPEETS
jgi:adenosylmethionine-8-amino-7-oxononanoate aminotransferase